MRNISLFVEDQAHQDFLTILTQQLIERWLLLDSAAFRKVFGKGCPTPDQKCERDRYKRLLLNAIYEAGIDPSSTDLEYIADLVSEMNLQRMEQIDSSIGRLLEALQRQFRIWQQADS